MKIENLFVNEKSKIKDTMKTIDSGGLGIVLIVDKNKKLLGIATDSDIRRAVMNGVNIESEIEKIMNKTPIVVKEPYTNLDISNLLLEVNKQKFPVYGILCIPVITKNREPKDILFLSEKNYVGKLSDSKLEVKKVHRVLVVGGAGYLGGILCKQLLDHGYAVRVLDNFMYGDDGIAPIQNRPAFEFINGDIRDIRIVVKAIKEVDAVIHLAAIVGDAASALDPKETIEINYLSSKMLAEVCKQSQINRFIFASTCSVYGANEPGKMLNENSKLNPVSLYAEMKLNSEKGILSLEDDNFSPTILRMGTLFGVSPRMRFDLVINVLTGKAIMEGKYSVFGGKQWRAFCHVKDAAKAYVDCLEAPIEAVKGQIFNVTPENSTINDIGKLIKKMIPNTKMIVDKTQVDQRDYCVSDKKIRAKIRYKHKYTISDGIKEIKSAILTDKKYTDYQSAKYYNHTYIRESRERTLEEF
jgi:nucleoside-diphosphate-sugar epimerase/predicted transcriptional regulator